MNAKEIALRVFEKLKYPYAADELDLFVQRIDKINELGLISLNKGIETATHRNIDDKLVEHNFAHELLKYQTNIEYEPPYLTLPPDFKIINNSIEFWFQVKNLSLLEKDKRKNTLFREIKQKLSSIKVQKFILIDLSDDFHYTDIILFIEFISIHAIKDNNIDYYFPSINNQKAKISFCLPNTLTLENLQLGIHGDLEFSLKEPAEHIRKSLCTAVKSFHQDENHNQVINIIVMEAGDNYRNKDIANALYGDEQTVYTVNSAHGIKQNGWNRDRNGFLQNKEISNKVTGILVIRPKDKNSILASYSKILFVNEEYKNRIDIIKQVIDIDDVKFFNLWIKD